MARAGRRQAPRRLGCRSRHRDRVRTRGRRHVPRTHAIMRALGWRRWNGCRHRALLRGRRAALRTMGRARHAAFGAFVDAQPDTVEPVLGAHRACGRSRPGTDVFAAQNELMALQRAVEHTFTDVDVVVVPTIPFLPTLAEVAADPIGVNGRLSRSPTSSTCSICPRWPFPAQPPRRSSVRCHRDRAHGRGSARRRRCRPIACRGRRHAGGNVDSNRPEPWPDGLPGLGERRGLRWWVRTSARAAAAPRARRSERLEHAGRTAARSGLHVVGQCSPEAGARTRPAPAPRSRWSCTR